MHESGYELLRDDHRRIAGTIMSTASLTPPTPAGDLTDFRAIIGSLIEQSFEIVIDVRLVCKIAGMSADAIGVRGAQAFQAWHD
jgi:hypothetical protein